MNARERSTGTQKTRSRPLMFVGLTGVVAIVTVLVAFLRAVDPAPFDGVIRGIDPATGEEMWRMELGMEPAPVFANDVLIVVEGGGIRAIEADGRTRLRHRDGRIVQARSAGSVVYAERDVGGADEIVAIDAQTGTIRWTREGRIREGGGHLAVVEEPGGRTLVLDATSGRELASIERRGVDVMVGDDLAALLAPGSLTVVRRDGATVELEVDPATRGPTLAGVRDPIVVTDHRHSPAERALTGYDITTGQVRWSGRFEPYDRIEQHEDSLWLWYEDRLSYLDIGSGRFTVDAEPSFRRMVTSAGGSVVVARFLPAGEASDTVTFYTSVPQPPGTTDDLGSQYATTLAVDATTSRVLWTVPGSEFVAANDRTAILRSRSEYIAVRAETGAVLTTIEAGRPTHVAAASQYAYLYANGRVVAVSADGTVTTPIETESTDRIAAADDDVIVFLGVEGRGSERRRNFVAYDVETGARLWRRPIEAYRSASIENGRLVVSRARATVSFDLATGRRSVARITGPGDPPARSEPSDPIETLVAFDAMIDRRLWTSGDLRPRDTIGVVGATVVVVELTPRFDS